MLEAMRSLWLLAAAFGALGCDQSPPQVGENLQPLDTVNPDDYAPIPLADLPEVEGQEPEEVEVQDTGDVVCRTTNLTIQVDGERWAIPSIGASGPLEDGEIPEAVLRGFCSDG